MASVGLAIHRHHRHERQVNGHDACGTDARDIAEDGEVKANIFRNQTGQDVLVLNDDDPLVKPMAERAASQVIPFSRLRNLENGACVQDGHIVFKKERISRVSEMKIQGVHNLENALAAVALSLAAGADRRAAAAVLREFPGLEHRLEFVRTKNGVTYINDSKGNNGGAVVKSGEGYNRAVR